MSHRNGDSHHPHSEPTTDREAIAELLERTRELSHAAARVDGELRAMRAEHAELKGIVIQTHAVAMATATRVERLDQERELPITRLGALRKDMAAVKQALQGEMMRGAETRATVAAHDKRLDDLSDDVEDTGQRQVDAIVKKAAELEAAQKRDVDARAERRRHWVRWGVQGVLAVALVMLGWLLKGGR